MANITKAELEIKNTELENRNVELESKIAELQKLVENATEAIKNMENTNTTKATEVANETENLTSDDVVEVVSQRVGSMTLSTEGYGKGIIYEFNEMNEIQDIPFGDLKEIVRHNREFAQNGYFYILNEQAVKQLRLKSAYDRLISFDDIRNLFNLKPENVIELYKMTTDAQKESIIEMVIDKKLNGANIDANILLALEQLSGKNILNVEA